MVYLAATTVAVAPAAADGGRVCRHPGVGDAIAAGAVETRMAALRIVRVDIRVRVCRARLQPVSLSGGGSHDDLAGRCREGIADVRLRRHLRRAAVDHWLYGVCLQRVLGQSPFTDVWGVKP